ncbi:hypothetical protein AAFF_G00346760 [Aldrovandia affinis]|uniref:Uncharacterized protein n=1 Tax=Aldrovandia affinis TaxID=143900 RepID=A0AAD7SJR9_9TELE|nr:hypothetical protein AAFF_G00346760 [Aldrovandia affinis]
MNRTFVQTLCWRNDMLKGSRGPSPTSGARAWTSDSIPNVPPPPWGKQHRTTDDITAGCHPRIPPKALYAHNPVCGNSTT